jgi:cyanate permease
VKVKLALQTPQQLIPEPNLVELERIKLEQHFNIQAATKSSMKQTKGYLQLAIAVCLVASLVVLQFDYGLPQALFIVTTLAGAIFGLVWSMDELKKILSK